MLLAIDPGTKAGWAQEKHGIRTSGGWCFETRKATKTRTGEPKHERILKAYRQLFLHGEQNGYPDVIVCEDAAGFTRGKSAVEASHKFRAVVELFAAQHNIELVYVQPADVKRWLTGKGNADKNEIMAAAASRFGYAGSDDNEADAIVIREWAIAHNYHKRERAA